MYGQMIFILSGEKEDYILDKLDPIKLGNIIEGINGVIAQLARALES